MTACTSFYRGFFNAKPTWALERRVPMGHSGIVRCSSHFNYHEQPKEATLNALGQLALAATEGIDIKGRVFQHESDVNGTLSSIIISDIESNFEITIRAKQYDIWSHNSRDMTCVWLKLL